MSPTELFTGVVPFLHVAEHLSFRRAGEQLGISTAAVSKAVARLEERLGTKLLARSSRTVALTPEGRVFLERSREAVGSMQAAEAQLARSRSQPRGDVRVSLSFILGPIVVAGLPALTARYPELAVHLEVTDRVSALLGENVDVALRVGARTESSLVSRVLYRPRWVTVASPSLLARHPAPAEPAELVHHNCVRFVDPRGQAVPWWFAEAPDAPPRALAVRGNLAIDQGELLLAAAIAGAGVAQLLDFMVADALRDGRLVEVLAPFACAGPTIHAVTAADRRKSPNIRAVVEHAAATFERLGR